MNARHADRLWIIGGLAVVLLLAIGSWFLLISPKFAEADEVRGQTGDTQTQLVLLRKRIAELKNEQAQLPQLTAALADSRRALPADSGVPAFLRQLQASGDRANVKVTGVTVSDPAQQDKLPAVWALPITLTAQGSADNLGRFLTELQNGQSRAVLIETANLSPQTTTTSADASGGTVTVSLSLKAFVAPPAGVGAPAVTK
jgi:Tfp pilus assembly protein PilO